MAKMKPPLSSDEIKKLSISELRNQYSQLAETCNDILDQKVCYCHKCNTFKKPNAFYNDKNNASGVFWECKECLLDEATTIDKKDGTRIDNREKTIAVFRKMDLPFIEALYNSCVQQVNDSVGEKNRATAYQHMLVQVKSLPNYAHMNFDNSEFYDDSEVYNGETNRRARKEIKKLFGSGFTENDYLYLQDQYDDWRARTQVDSKSQETYVMQICLQLLDIDKDRKTGKDVSNKLKALDTLMNAANLQPKQNVGNSATDQLSFGQLIEKWEMDKPIPEPSEEFKDVDGIGKYIRVWFTGWLAKALGIKNVFSKECEDYMKQYLVEKQQDSEEYDVTSKDIYEAMFGKDGG